MLHRSYSYFSFCVSWFSAIEKSDTSNDNRLTHRHTQRTAQLKHWASLLTRKFKCQSSRLYGACSGELSPYFTDSYFSLGSPKCFCEFTLKMILQIPILDAPRRNLGYPKRFGQFAAKTIKHRNIEMRVCHRFRFYQ